MIPDYTYFFIELVATVVISAIMAIVICASLVWISVY